jgi:hypothetical protein
LVELPDGKRLLGTHRRWWDHNAKIDYHKVGWGGMNWIDLAEDRDRWRALVNAEWTFGFRKMWGNSWLGEGLLATEEGLCSMDLVS